MLVVLVVVRAVSAAEQTSGQQATSYIPRLSDLMVAIQIRHAKLFYAVKRENWPLADYELDQLVASLTEAQRYYPRTTPPMTDVPRITTSLDDAVKARDQAKFDRAFDEMNAGCNQCHEAADRSFILIRRPSYPSTFSNQLYSPRPTEQQRGH
jgi:hypothetical protein